MKIMKELKHIIEKNLENLGYLFLRRNTGDFYKNQRYENFGKF